MKLIFWIVFSISICLLVFIWYPNTFNVSKESSSQTILEEVQTDSCVVAYKKQESTPVVIYIKEEEKSSWKEIITFIIGGINSLLVILMNYKKLRSSKSKIN